MASHEDLREILGRRFDDGSRRAVLVVGSGLNFEALRRLNGDLCGESWAELLEVVGGDLATFENLTSMTGRWEHILCALAECDGEQPHVHEQRLRKEVQRFLRRREAEVEADEPSLYRTLAHAGFRDIVSFNIDRRLALAGGANGRVRCAVKDHRLDEALFRHDVVAHDEIETRVWYPHGDTALRKTLKLGVRSYGRYVASMGEAFNRFKAFERLHGEADVEQAARERPDLTWIDLFMVSDLVFVGMGLSQDEWTIWWALHQRQRNQARWKTRRSTLLLASKEASDWDGLQRRLAGPRAGVEIVAYDSFEAMWHGLEQAVDASSAP